MADRGIIFEKVKVQAPIHNTFDLSYENKLTCNMGDLIPFCFQECLPGDRYRGMSSQVMVRMTPMLAPIFHRIDLYVHYFFVPLRLVWDDSTKFLSPGDGLITMAQAGEYVPPVKPYLDMRDLANAQSSLNQRFMQSGTLWDYFGLPSIGDTPSDLYPYISSTSVYNMLDEQKIDVTPFRAYQLIYNEYYRDENMTEPIEFSHESGKMTYSGMEDLAKFHWLLDIRRRCWEKEYFTSALPTPQRGMDVMLPLGESAPVNFFPHNFNGEVIETQNGRFIQTDSYRFAFSSDFYTEGQGAPLDSTKLQAINTNNPGPYPSSDDSKPYLTAQVNLEQATSINIESLRESMMLQSFFEKAARCGARYDETVKGSFNVWPGDARLQRPEYLGGGKQPIVISEIDQTSASNAEDTPQGNAVGKGTSVTSSNSFSYTATEHGYIIGILSIRPKTAYSQGIPRKFTRFDMYDYAWPDFANLGEQAVFNKELYFGADEYNEEVFGYQSRYADYKYNCDEFHGDFRTNLNYWHLGRQFDSRPGLNTQFLEISDVNRIFAITDEDKHHFYIDAYNYIMCDRCLPKFAIPKF